MTLKKQLRFYLEKHGWTAAELSRRSGVSQQTLSLWLKGGEPKKMSQIKAVASCINISIDHLVYGTGPEPDQPNELEGFVDGEWVSGLFEVKIRRIKR